jgi:hypothetical protein
MLSTNQQVQIRRPCSGYLQTLQCSIACLTVAMTLPITSHRYPTSDEGRGFIARTKFPAILHFHSVALRTSVGLHLKARLQNS